VNLERALAEYRDAPQMFAPYVNALTLCALGDVRRFAGRYDEAVECYLRARALIHPVCEMIGGGYLEVRLLTRLATAYHLLWMRRDEMECATSALGLTRNRQPGSFNWCWLTCEGALHYDWAIYHATRGDRSSVITSLAAAIGFGWRETSGIDLEPAFEALRADQQFVRQLETAAARPALPRIDLA
jgi:tetratricopeptide (TPR) repeat protein